MIRIKKIGLRNFKSFKKADIPLSTGFTAIVGSNGSGKSNILDAFLFVFGINSLKALRASRMTELVNNQAKDDYAKVEVELFDNVSKKEYLISRTIDTSGKSVMRLNDRRVTLNEVASLLEELGIKPFGHNIVVQGDVTRIIEMNAIQRREMIDEVAGIREFDEKKEEAYKELGNVEQKIKEVRIVLSERQSQLEQLSQDRQAAMRHNELLEELKKTKATLFKAEITRLTDELLKNAEKKARLDEERGKKETRLSESRTELSEIERSVEQANADLVAASEKTFSEVGIRIEEKKSERRVREERMTNRRQAVEKTI
ncbi:MAG: AAA family ATPase, partial [Candidatus Diapherotrites archaeon]|nr:AAA family ATPase [Candidatus Diapherotrites archaeon]